MLPVTASVPSGPSPPDKCRVLGASTKVTVMCWTLPAGRVSQKQPPARGSSERFDAWPDHVCAGSHHDPICRSARYTFAGGALTSIAILMEKPAGVASMTSAASGVEIRNSATKMIENRPNLQPPVPTLLIPNLLLRAVPEALARVLHRHRHRLAAALHVHDHLAGVGIVGIDELARATGRQHRCRTSTTSPCCPRSCSR